MAAQRSPVNRGFSLAETAVALAVLGLILIFVLNLFPSAMVARATSEQRLTAQSLARSALEQHLETPFQQLRSGPLPPVERDGVRYDLSLEVSPSPQARPEYLQVLTLTVRWTARGKAQQVQRQLYRHRLPHQVGL